MNNAIEVYDLCKAYPGFALKNVSFTVPEGLCCGFVGPNGAGKSTTLKILAGLTFPDSGEARLLGRPCSDPAVRDELLDIFREYMVPENRTILFSTHITGELERIADKIVYIHDGTISYKGDTDSLTSSYCMVRGGELPAEKQKYAIGMRQTDSGFECLMALEHIGGLPAGVVTENASVNDVIVYMERNEKNG